MRAISPDAFFTAEFDRRASESPMLSRLYGYDVRPLTDDEAARAAIVGDRGAHPRRTGQCDRCGAITGPRAAYCPTCRDEVRNATKRRSAQRRGR